MIEGAVPAARDIAEFDITNVGPSEFVLFDRENLHYHTLNEGAFATWRLCDGDRSLEQIRLEMRVAGYPVPAEAIEMGVLSLLDAGLLQVESVENDSVMANRRMTLKLAIAALGGVFLLPAVSSISQPAVAETSGECRNSGYPGPPCANLGYCTDPGCVNFCRNSGLGNCAQCDNVNTSEGGCCNCFNSDVNDCPCF